jgi:glutaredoxin-like protein
MLEIDEETKNNAREMLSPIDDTVKVYLYSTKDHCLYCNETVELVTIVCDLNDYVKLEVCSCELDDERSKKHGVDRHPAIVIEGKNKGKIRFFGIPSGYEFASLIRSLLTANGKIELSEATIEKVKGFTKPVHMQVFVTPTCPYCPQSVILAHEFASVSELITADMVEAMEHQELSMKYEVRGVPKTIINETIHAEGAMSEQMILEKLLESQK